MDSLSSSIDVFIIDDVNTINIRCDNFYFLTNSEKHIFEHLPDKKVWQLLRTPVTLDEFMRLPILKSNLFNAGLSLKKRYLKFPMKVPEGS
jgi:transglutaminase/protease-like cytokinesis protein 3